MHSLWLREIHLNRIFPSSPLCIEHCAFSVPLSHILNPCSTHTWEGSIPVQGSADLGQMSWMWGHLLIQGKQFHCGRQPAPGSVQKEHIRLRGAGPARGADTCVRRGASHMALIYPCQHRQGWEELGEGLACVLRLPSLGDN